MRKMLDIVPQEEVVLEEQPKKEKKKKKARGGKIRRKLKEGIEKRKERKERKERKSKKREGFFPFSRIFFALGVFVIVAGAVFVILTLKSKLTLTLYFAQEEISVQDEVKVDVEKTEPDLENKVIPGKLFGIEKEKWEVFAATGKVAEDQRAQGLIKAYNSHNPPRPVALVAQTRFLSSGGGKIFLATQKIYLPPASFQGGKLVPSVTEIKVQAQEPGPDYNIAPSKFSVPGLAGTALYYTVWAESGQTMQGGTATEVLKITEDDLKNAKVELAKILRNTAQEGLIRELPKEFILLQDGATIEEDIETTCFKEAETVAPDFNCRGKINLKGLAFKEEDSKTIALGFLQAIKPSSKELKEDSLEMSFVLRGAAAKAGKMVLSVSAKAKAYERLNQDLLFYQLYGKKAEHIKKLILDNFPQIEKVQLKFWPFWVRTAPKNIERIKIILTPLQP